MKELITLMQSGKLEPTDVMCKLAKVLEVQQAELVSAKARIADMLHYPSCWDTAAYPTVESALHEVAMSFHCNNDDCSAAHDAELINDEKRNPWKSAIIEAAVVGWTYSNDHDTNPRAAVHELLVMEAQMALDPLISGEAATLVANAKKAALLEAADRVDHDVTYYGTAVAIWLRRMAAGEK